MRDAPAVPAMDRMVDWVCARAEANNSLSRCEACQWFELPDLTQRHSIRGAHVQPTWSASSCSLHRARLAWFMCLTPATDTKALKHLEYVKAAILSARFNAPTLAPHIILISHEDAKLASEHASEFELANSRFRKWLRRAGVPLLTHRLSFYDLLPLKLRRRRTSLNPNLNVGAFGRLDIGLVVSAMRSELAQQGLDTERVLYTDTDVLFARDVDYAYLSSVPLATFAAGTEVFSPALNTGVMLINATAWSGHYADMVAYGQSRDFKFLSYDQTWVQEYFSKYAAARGLGRGWTALTDAEYNARGFMHPIKAKRGRQVAFPRMWHWHGFKPRDVECWHHAIRTGKWPVRAWRNTVPECTSRTRPRCLFMPIHNSGCRYFGRLTHVLSRTPCYLRTYTYLLQQHKKMLGLAEELEGTALSRDEMPSSLHASYALCDVNATHRATALERRWSEELSPSLERATRIGV